MKRWRERVYFGSPVFLQNLMVSAYGFRLRGLRYGQRHQELLHQLRRTEWLSADELGAHQLSELNTVIDQARSVPIYRNRGLPDGPLRSLDELAALPILRKDELRAPKADLVSEPYRTRRTLEIHTGGTTGTPLVIYCDGEVLQRNYAFFSRFLEWAGFEQHPPRVATFAGRTIVSPHQQKGPFWRSNIAMRQQLFSSYHISEATIPTYVAGLRRFQPELIDSYPSSIRPIARYLLQNGLFDLKPRAVVTSSETLDDTTRRLVERAFGCPVFDHYGGAEMVALVTQCRKGSYHVNPEFGIVEVLKDGKPAEPGTVGELVATGFINPVMPLIRYATGDMAAWSREPCACGRAFPVLKGIEGRKDDVLITPEGRLVGRLDPIFKSVGSIYETRIVQDRIDHVNVDFVPADGFQESDLAVLRTELQRRLGPLMHISFRRMSELPRTGGGKLRAVVNLVPLDAAPSPAESPAELLHSDDPA